MRRFALLLLAALGWSPGACAKPAPPPAPPEALMNQAQRGEPEPESVDLPRLLFTDDCLSSVTEPVLRIGASPAVAKASSADGQEISVAADRLVPFATVAAALRQLDGAEVIRIVAVEAPSTRVVAFRIHLATAVDERGKTALPQSATSFELSVESSGISLSTTTALKSTIAHFPPEQPCTVAHPCFPYEDLRSALRSAVGEQRDPTVELRASESLPWVSVAATAAIAACVADGATITLVLY